jgi:sugar lactone lactonase YvrE
MKTNINDPIILQDGDKALPFTRSSTSPTKVRKSTCGSKLAGVAALFTLLFVNRAGAQNIFVSNFLGDNVTEFDSNGNVVNANYVSGLSNPEGLGFDESGNLYTANYGSPNIVQVGPGGSPVNSSFATFAGPQHWAGGMAIDSSGDIYVSNQGSFSVSKFSPTGNLLTTIGAGSLLSPQGVAIGPNGNLYVVSGGNDRISEFSPNGTIINLDFIPLSGIVGSPTGLAFDANGNIYVAEEQAQGYVAEFSPSGTLINASFATGLDEPIGMAFNASGDLYVVNSQVPRNGVPFTVSEFNTSGDLINTLSGGLDNPTYIAIEPVPEPSTWALFLLGAVGFTALHYRRANCVANKLLSS